MENLYVSRNDIFYASVPFNKDARERSKANVKRICEFSLFSSPVMKKGSFKHPFPLSLRDVGVNSESLLTFGTSRAPLHATFFLF